MVLLANDAPLNEVVLEDLLSRNPLTPTS